MSLFVELQLKSVCLNLKQQQYRLIPKEHYLSLKFYTSWVTHVVMMYMYISCTFPRLTWVPGSLNLSPSCPTQGGWECKMLLDIFSFSSVCQRNWYMYLVIRNVSNYLLSINPCLSLQVRISYSSLCYFSRLKPHKMLESQMARFLLNLTLHLVNKLLYGPVVWEKDYLYHDKTSPVLFYTSLCETMKQIHWTMTCVQWDASFTQVYCLS